MESDIFQKAHPSGIIKFCSRHICKKIIRKKIPNQVSYVNIGNGNY